VAERLRTLTRRTVTVGVLAAAAGAATAAGGALPGGRAASAGVGRDDVLASGRRTAPTATGPPAGPVRPAASAVARAAGRTADAGLSGDGASPAGPSGVAATALSAQDRPELPRGGRSLFPRYRVVAYAGLPGTPALGRLGIGDLDTRTAELERLAARHVSDGREPLPALELVTVVAQSRPGRDGRFRVRIDPGIVDDHLAAARRCRALLLLNIQPGRASLLDEVRAHARWLREPDVGVALDPEWAVRGRARPGEVFGYITGSELDAVSAWLAGVVADHDLPDKLMVVHVLAPSVLRRTGPLRRRPGVQVVRSADGIGGPVAKRRSWVAVQAGGAKAGARHGAGVLSPGFKLFFVEDARGRSRLMTPSEVLALRPVPDYVCYE